MKTKHLFKIMLLSCVLQFGVLLVKAQPAVKIYLPGHAPFISTPFYPMLGAGEKNKLGVLKYTKEETDTLFEAVKNKTFKTVVMKFYKKLVDGQPVEKYATFTLTGVTVTTVDLADFQLKPKQTTAGPQYPIPFMFTFRSETHTNK